MHFISASPLALLLCCWGCLLACMVGVPDTIPPLLLLFHGLAEALYYHSCSSRSWSHHAMAFSLCYSSRPAASTSTTTSRASYCSLKEGCYDLVPSKPTRLLRRRRRCCCLWYSPLDTLWPSLLQNFQCFGTTRRAKQKALSSSRKLVLDAL